MSRGLSLSMSSRTVGTLFVDDTARAEPKNAIRCPSAASGKQVRECGARVKSENVFSRSVLIPWYISALPQYLERYAARYVNPLRHTNSCKSARNLKRKWVRFCAEHVREFRRKRNLRAAHHKQKEIGTPIGGDFSGLVSHSQAKSNSACPTLTNLKSGEFDPPEIKLLDKLEFDD